MTPALRPMSLGEILDRTFQIYRSRFWLFVGICLIPVLAMELIQAADHFWLHTLSLVHPVRQPGIFLWGFVVGLGYYHVASIFVTLIEPAAVKPASNLVVGGESTIVSSLRFAAARWRSYLWIAFLKIGADLVIPEAVFASLVVGGAFLGYKSGISSQDARWAVLLGALLVFGMSVSLFLWLGACLSLAVPAAALEGITGFSALRRSWALSKGSRGRICSTWLALYASSWVLAWCLELLLGQLMLVTGRVLHLSGTMHHLYAPAVYVLVTAIYAILSPIGPIALTLFYYDQRIRLEGYDIEHMIHIAGMNLPSTPDAPGVLAPQPAVAEGAE